MPDTTVTFPLESVEVTVERRVASLMPAERAKSKCSFGAAANSSSPPTLRAFGTLNMSRDEHEPAVTVTWRSLTST